MVLEAVVVGAELGGLLPVFLLVVLSTNSSSSDLYLLFLLWLALPHGGHPTV